MKPRAREAVGQDMEGKEEKARQDESSSSMPESVAGDRTVCYESAHSYFMEWSPTQSANLRALSTAEDLRTLLRASTQPTKPGAHNHTSTTTKLVVIHGLPADHIEVLRDEIGLDSEIVEAQAARRCCRTRRQPSGALVLSLEHPELIEGNDAGSTNSDGIVDMRNHGEVDIQIQTIDVELDGTKIRGDFSRSPPRYALSSAGPEAVFCHSSIWVGANVTGDHMFPS
jgi:hypothetical protein